jgi:hypothetical protein
MLEINCDDFRYIELGVLARVISNNLGDNYCSKWNKITHNTNKKIAFKLDYTREGEFFFVEIENEILGFSQSVVIKPSDTFPMNNFLLAIKECLEINNLGQYYLQEYPASQFFGCDFSKVCGLLEDRLYDSLVARDYEVTRNNDYYNGIKITIKGTATPFRLKLSQSSETKHSTELILSYSFEDAHTSHYGLIFCAMLGHTEKFLITDTKMGNILDRIETFISLCQTITELSTECYLK